MNSKTKRHKKILALVEKVEMTSLDKAIDILKDCPKIKFDPSIEVSLKLGVDPKKADQQVRGTVSLPNGTGKTVKILVLAKGDKAQEALAAGADYAGEEYIEKVNAGWTDFDIVIATPDMMREVGKLGKVLGPRGLMPSPKAGTVAQDVAKAVKESKAGKIEFKVDKSGVVNNMVGKISFTKEGIIQNIITLLSAINRAKPATAKGIYMQSLTLSCTMGPGIKIDLPSLSLS